MINRKILVGNLVRDAEAVSTTGKPMTRLRLATNTQWTDAEGEKHEAAEFHAVVCFGRLAEFAAMSCQGTARVHRGQAPHPPVRGHGRRPSLGDGDRRPDGQAVTVRTVSPSAPDAAVPGGRKSWMRHHKILTGLGVVIVLFVGSAAVNGIVEGIQNPPPTPTARTAAQPQAPVPVPPPSRGQSAVPASPATSRNSSLATTRGLLGTVSYWDRTYQRLPESACAAQGEVKLPVGVLDSWQISSGGIACYNTIGDGTGPPWGDHIVGLDVYFPRHVNEQIARRAVAALLPADAQALGPFPGMNNDTSAQPEGSCQHIVYTSAALATAVRGANPTWTADPTKADMVFYSGHATSADGADTPFNPNSINEVLITIGDGNPHAGSYTC